VRAAAAMLAALLLACASSAGVAPTEVQAAAGVHLDSAPVTVQHATLAAQHRHGHPQRLVGTAAAILGGSSGAHLVRGVHADTSGATGRPAGRAATPTRTRAPPV
jgi:hypothetical protein